MVKTVCKKRYRYCLVALFATVWYWAWTCFSLYDCKLYLDHWI